MKNILLVDDDCSMLEYYKHTLIEHPNYNIYFAKNLVEAHRILDHKTLHLIICDYFLNEETGLEFLRSIKRYNEDLPVIILSGAKQDHNIKWALEANTIQNFISKPVKSTELDHLINQYSKNIEIN